MKKALTIALLVSIPLLLLAVAWQTGRYDALADEARRLEASQESWIQENRKLEASIRIMSSRERIASIAQGLGLEMAGPDRRLRVVIRPQATGAGSATSAKEAGAKK